MLVARRPHVLLPLLQREVGERFGLSSKYARGVLDAAYAIGILARFSGSQRIARFSLSPVGRSIVAAEAAEDIEVRQLSLLAALLNSDADAYYSILATSEHTDDNDASKSREALFGNNLRDIYVGRRAWLQKTFPSRILRDRIVRQIVWRKEEQRTGVHYLRHHARPRLGWAKSLGHVDIDNHLTEDGRRLLVALRGDSHSYFWLGPSESTLTTLRIPADNWPAPPRRLMERPSPQGVSQGGTGRIGCSPREIHAYNVWAP